MADYAVVVSISRRFFKIYLIKPGKPSPLVTSSSHQGRAPLSLPRGRSVFSRSLLSADSRRPRYSRTCWTQRWRSRWESRPSRRRRTRRCSTTSTLCTTWPRRTSSTCCRSTSTTAADVLIGLVDWARGAHTSCGGGCGTRQSCQMTGEERAARRRVAELPDDGQGKSCQMTGGRAAR